MEEKSNIDKLEEALKKFYTDYGKKSVPKKGVHTEVVIEPRFFMGGKLNPEIADLLVSVYLSQSTSEDVKRGKISLSEEIMVIKDKFGKPMVNIRNQRIIREFKQKI